MTSQERVQRCIDRKGTDRVPIFMWFHPQTVERLAEHFGVATETIDFVMANDVRQTWVNNNYAMEGIVHDCEGQGHLDEWGIRWERRHGFNQAAGFPLKNAERNDVLAYRFPVDRVDELIARLGTALGDSSEWYRGCDVSPCAFEMYWRLRGMEDALMDFAVDQSLAAEMIGRCADFALELSRRAGSAHALDWLWTGDDVASQTGMIISPDTWRAVVKPHLARIVAHGRRLGLPVAYHCCGALRPIIPDLIEIGVSVLNPIQAGCPGMEPEGLKRDFGADLTFMGGLDTQHVIPNANADEVRRHTGELIETMTAGDAGGYILAASHTIPPETPIENILAMYAAAGVSSDELVARAASAGTPSVGTEL